MAEEFEAAGIYGGNYWWNMMNNNCFSISSSTSPLCSIAANNYYGGNSSCSTWQTHHNLMDLKSPLLVSHQDSMDLFAHEQEQSQNESSPSSASYSTWGFSLPPSSATNLSVFGVDSSKIVDMKRSMDQRFVVDQQNLSYGMYGDEEHNTNIHLHHYQPQPEDSLFTNPCLAYSYNNSTNQVSPKQQLDAEFNISNNNNASSPQSQPFEQKSSCSPLLTKHKREEQTPLVSEEPNAIKMPRIETPSSLPTFKVRKEKLGDRITALQQLVSPFGKTDTASVLHEAIEYIKYLHDQVSVLSAPYLNKNNGRPTAQHYQSCDHDKESKGAKQDLRSQGLCLAPISSTFTLSNYDIMTSESWAHAYGGAHHLMR